MTAHLRHVTLHTGHVREVDRDEIDPGALAICEEIVAVIADDPQVTHWRLPNMPGLSIAGQSGGGCLMAGIFAHDRDLLVTFGVAANRHCGADTWRALHDSSLAITDPDRQPPQPWIATLIGPHWERVVAPDPMLRTMLSALGSCLGWAWLSHLDRAR